MSITRFSPSVSSVAATCLLAVVSFDSRPAGDTCDMLGDRSSSTIAAAERSPPAAASQPCESGRLTARIAAATASTLRARIRNCRNRV